MGALSNWSLDVVLEDRIKRNPTLLWPFDAASKHVYRGMHANTPKHMEMLHKITEKTIQDFGVTDPPKSAFADWFPWLLALRSYPRFIARNERARN